MSQPLENLGVKNKEGKVVLASPDPEMLIYLQSTIKYNMARKWPELQPVRPHTGIMHVVAGGPNLEEAFIEYKQGPIICVNQAHDWLLAQDIIPDYCAFMDNKAVMVDTIKEPHPDVHYLCASMTAPELLDKLDGFQVSIWHALQGYGEEEALPKTVNLIGGGNNIGQRAISLAYYLGYRNMQCYGLCGCILDDKVYAYKNNTPLLMAREDVNEYKFKDYTFKGTANHANQAASFWTVLCHFDDAAITVHGRGIIPHMAEVYWKERAKFINSKRGKSS